MACEAGKQYRIVVKYSVVSSYTNGNPWSVAVGGTTVTLGAGASVAWTQQSAVVTCAASSADNLVKFSLSSNNNRAARLLVDFVTVTPV
ncbi:hypothetical protein QBC42DRAFT_314388 [Cladorrhinum samala]|uniref:Uncharacterized protein n=1 Tax=Cladorrhinum samala TaxID=585594 RepID=A0AAV9HWD0_9PEZI|nr:hypothetical protein QBC42DRAFT_314388 [Cladorrhinum samala]